MLMHTALHFRIGCYSSPPLHFNKHLFPKQCPPWRCFHGTSSIQETNALLLNSTISDTIHTTTDETQACINATCINVLQKSEKDYFDHEGNAPDNHDEIKIKDSIDYIKWMLNTMEDGRISISPYDTAWVALIPNVSTDDECSSPTPHFPSSLEWIVDNQLSDGSWGEPRLFSPYDRLLNTLACVIALQTWKVRPAKIEQGVTFIKENISKLESADAENMTCGFEVVFPALLEKARNLGIQLPYDSPSLQRIYDTRALKMTRIPKEVMYKAPTALLFNLEGLPDLDWEKVLKLQTPPGSFLTSPASTAFAVINTRDEASFTHLQQIVAKFNGGVPTNFPVDLYARLFAVDRLQRLGISRYFQSEINNCLEYVRRYWTENGIFCARNSKFYDIDDTAMGFRLLRLNGYNVSPDVFRNFKDGDEFCCYKGQISESPTPIFNLYRASQLLFPGEKILEDARKFSYQFLKDRLLLLLSNNKLLDKWLISKDLAGEVRNGLEVPWYGSLPRVENRLYIQQYGGADDVWIGKSLYRMPEISNDVYLDLARSDFNKCQAQHQTEWTGMLRWHKKCNLEEFGISEDILLRAYFIAAANKFEEEKLIERIAWAKSVVICNAIKSCLCGKDICLEQSVTLINGQGITNGSKRMQALHGILLNFVHQLSVESAERSGRDIRHHLLHLWEMWLIGLNGEDASAYQEEAELLVNTINLCSASDIFCSDIVPHQQQTEYKRLSNLTNKICHKLTDLQHKKVNGEACLDMEMELEFQLLVQLVLENSAEDGIGNALLAADMKQNFLAVAKTYYYTTYCSQDTIDMHIFKVLFHPVS